MFKFFIKRIIQICIKETTIYTTLSTVYKDPPQTNNVQLSQMLSKIKPICHVEVKLRSINCLLNQGKSHHLKLNENMQPYEF